MKTPIQLLNALSDRNKSFVRVKDIIFDFNAIVALDVYFQNTTIFLSSGVEFSFPMEFSDFMGLCQSQVSNKYRPLASEERPDQSLARLTPPNEF